MFGFIKKLFSQSDSKKNVKDETINKLATSLSGSKKKKVSTIPYNPELIDSLKTEHQDLLSSFGHIMDSAEKKRYPLLAKTLKDFSNLLNAHLTKEGIELYVFLEFSTHIDNPDVFRDFRREMSEIASVVMGVINRYTKKAVSDETVDQFIKEFTELGGVLVDRIEREENMLYTLYSE
ncbi:MAG: hemerythrin domain-containing protein [Methylococcales bacterium]|nr:hemerythrin domain-containing protein [Methylococcales bacterium]